jgi:hypothetical protein
MTLYRLTDFKEPRDIMWYSNTHSRMECCCSKLKKTHQLKGISGEGSAALGLIDLSKSYQLVSVMR